MTYRGYNPLVAIQMALSGQIYAQTGEWLHQMLIGLAVHGRGGDADFQPVTAIADNLVLRCAWLNMRIKDQLMRRQYPGQFSSPARQVSRAASCCRGGSSSILAS